MRKAAPSIVMCMALAAAVGIGIYRGEPLIPLLLKGGGVVALLLYVASVYRDGKRSAQGT